MERSESGGQLSAGHLQQSEVNGFAEIGQRDFGEAGVANHAHSIAGDVRCDERRFAFDDGDAVRFGRAGAVHFGQRTEVQVADVRRRRIHFVDENRVQKAEVETQQQRQQRAAHNKKTTTDHK
jgi:hypothetical protein